MNGVPDIEEELSFLSEGNFSGEGDESVKKTLAPNPNAEYHVTYLKFIEGKKDDSSSLNPRPVRRTTLPKTKPVRTDPLNEELTVKDKPQEEFPSDPQDDPRYYPLPKSTDKRSFESSDSEQEFFNKKDDTETKAEESNKEILKQSDTTELVVIETNNSETKMESKSEDTKKDKSDTMENSGTNERRTRSQRRTKSTRRVLEQEELEDVPELENSDLDPAWDPSESDDGTRRRRSKRVRTSKPIVIRDSTSSSEDEFEPSKSKKKNSGKNIKPTIKVAPPPPEANVPKKEFFGRKITDPPPVIPSMKVKAVPHAKFPYNPGDFVIATSDQKYYHPPIWRVKEQNMLHRFMHFVKNGSTFYFNIPTFTAWSPGSKYTYEPVKIKFISQIKRDLTVKLETRNLHKITSGQEIVETVTKETQKYQDYFEIFIQALISQCLDGNFLTEIFSEKDDFFLSNIRVIDELCQELKGKLVTLLNWPEELSIATSKLPSYGTKLCNAICSCEAKAEVCVSLEGVPYDYKTLALLDEQINAVDVRFCYTCFEYFQIVHKLSHFKLYLFSVCEDQVKSKKLEENSKKTTIVLSELLADNDWLHKMFFDACKLWAYTEKLIFDLKKK